MADPSLAERRQSHGAEKPDLRPATVNDVVRLASVLAAARVPELL
jgi:hypothetical protein